MTSGNISLNPQGSRSINDKCFMLAKAKFNVKQNEDLLLRILVFPLLLIPMVQINLVLPHFSIEIVFGKWYTNIKYQIGLVK